MSDKLTPDQMERAILANRLQLFGFPDTARPIVERLKRETRPNYGRVNLDQAPSAFAGVERPVVSPTLDR